MFTLLMLGLANAVCAALLAIPAVLVSRYLRRPALAHALWLLVLLKLVTPPLVQPPLSWLPPEPTDVLTENPAQVVMRDAGADSEVWMQTQPVTVLREAEPGSRFDSLLVPAMWGSALIWLGGTLLILARLFWHMGQFSRLLRLAIPAEAALQDQCDALARNLGLQRGPRVFLVPGPLPPLVWGLPGRVAIYFPMGLLALLDGPQRASLLTHELAHVRRRDHWVRVLELVVIALYWWFPLVWLARRAMHTHEEECCDTLAVTQAPPRIYAGAILQTLDFLAGTEPPLPALASGLSTAEVIKQRLTTIMTGCRPARVGLLGKMALLALSLALLPLAPRLVRAAPPAVTDHPVAVVTPATLALKPRVVDTTTKVIGHPIELQGDIVFQARTAVPIQEPRQGFLLAANDGNPVRITWVAAPMIARTIPGVKVAATGDRMAFVPLVLEGAPGGQVIQVGDRTIHVFIVQKATLP